jgi:predicted nucleic acid-binding protein
MSIPDDQIAAIAKNNGLTISTRNTSDFEDCGIELVDPFLPNK